MDGKLLLTLNMIIHDHLIEKYNKLFQKFYRKY